MTTINEAFKNAFLADAAYVDGLTSASILSSDLAPRMTPDLATYISQNFSVVTQIESGLSSFDATVWRETATGKIYVSMRGTQQATDFLVDADLAVTGNARAQVTDMVNWWLRISTPVGQQAQQISALGSLYVAAPLVAGLGLVSPAELAAGIQVNGHSLGGYLATAFTRLFGTQAHVEHTSTFNSAGFAPGSEAVFTGLQNLIGVDLGLGRFPNGAEQTNYFASNGLNFTTNSFYFNQQGQRVEVFNESNTTQVGNHYMYKLTDALALGNALSKLDTTLTIDKLNALLSAGSNQTAASIEGVFDGIRKALAGPNAQVLPIGDVSDSAPVRSTYHATLVAFQNNPVIKGLAGQLIIRSAGMNLGAAARNDFGALIALQDLLPLWITGKDAVADAQLQEIWQVSRSADYAAWQADKTSLNPTAFTDGWIADRAALVQALTSRNKQDNTTGLVFDPVAPSGKATVFHFTDPSSPISETVLITQRQGGTVLPEQHIIFGNDQANTLLGYDNPLGDHLYAAAGNDTLDGGKGDDKLYGGSGSDTYVFTPTDLAGWGADTIVDDDGIIQVGTDTLSGGKSISPRLGRAWLSDDRKYQYQFKPTVPGGIAADSTGTLVIHRTGRLPDKESIVLANWSQGKFGITLSAEAALPVSPAQIRGKLGSGLGFQHLFLQSKSPCPDRYALSFRMRCTTSPRGVTGGRRFITRMVIERRGWRCWGRVACASTGWCMPTA